MKTGGQWRIWMVISAFCLAGSAEAEDAATVTQPQSAGSTLDSLLASYFRDHGVPASSFVNDRTFIRRASLDLTGVLPSPAEVDAYVANPAPDKRLQLVDRLLADREAYATHWLTFWNDALRNAYRGTGFIDNGRVQITGWLFRSLYENKPYDEFVHDLVAGAPGCEGFIRGIKWRGVVNESQRPEIQAAQNLAQVFLGTNLKCASCHDSFVNDWKLKDAYRLASVFADQPLEIHHCDKPTGELSDIGYIYPTTAEIDAEAPRDERLRQLADLLTRDQPDLLARVAVNRLWAQLMGRAIVEPRDNMAAKPFDQAVLDWLTRDLVEHDFDLKHTLRTVAGSRAYALPANDVSSATKPEQFVFQGPAVKRMTAEQYVDALSAVTAAPGRPDSNAFQPDGRAQGGQLAAVVSVMSESNRSQPPAELAATGPPNADAARLALPGAKWVWSNDRARSAKANEQARFRRTFELESVPDSLWLLVTADNAWELFINGTPAGQGAEWTTIGAINAQPYLVKGRNVIAILATNGGGEPNPAGLLLAATSAGRPDLASNLSSSDEWLTLGRNKRGWQQRDFDDGDWRRAAEIAASSEAPWKLLERVTPASLDFAANARTWWGDRPVRAALRPRDVLQAALGRPTREQPVTIRESKATLLEALELTNGASLDELVRQGGAHWSERTEATDSKAEALFMASLSRPPSADEQALAREVLGADPGVDEWRDLLWMIVMLPEFQLIY